MRFVKSMLQNLSIVLLSAMIHKSVSTKVYEQKEISSRYSCIDSAALGKLIKDLRPDVSEGDFECLKFARQLVLEQGFDWNCTDTQVNIQGEYIEVSLSSGSGNRQLNVFRDIRNENKMVYKYSRRYEKKKIRRSPMQITVGFVSDLIDELKPDITDMDRRLLQAAREMVTTHAREWIWRDARMDIYGQNLDIEVTSGEKTNKFSILLNGNDSIVARCNFKGWQFWAYDTSDNLWTAINDGSAAKVVINNFAHAAFSKNTQIADSNFDIVGAGFKMYDYYKQTRK